MTKIETQTCFTPMEQSLVSLIYTKIKKLIKLRKRKGLTMIPLRTKMRLRMTTIRHSLTRKRRKPKDNDKNRQKDWKFRLMLKKRPLSG